MSERNSPIPEASAIDCEVSVENVGGISGATVEFRPGVTLVAGRNASNKSSLLAALAGVLGGPVPTLRSDADAGSVTMTVGGESYRLGLARRDGRAVVTDTEPYSDEREVCELFVALTEENPIRQAVLSGDDLRDLLLRPIDTEEVEARIRELRRRKRTLDDRLDELDELAGRRSTLVARRETLDAELKDVKSRLGEAWTRIDEAEAALDAERADADELRDRRAERSDLRARIETHEDALASLRSELDEVTSELDDLAGENRAADLDGIEDQLSSLHERKRRLAETITTLTSVVDLSAEYLDDDAEAAGLDSTDVVGGLDPASRTLTCWTCGNTVERSDVEAQVEAIREVVREKRNERDTVTERIQALTEQQRELEAERDRLDELTDRKAEIEAELTRRTETRDDLVSRRRAVESEIERLADESGDGTGDRLAELYDEAADLEYERGRLATELEEVTEEIAEVDEALAERSELREERDAVATELRDERDRIDRLERDLVTTFNGTMEPVLDTLDYDAVERVWLERRAEAADPDTPAEFELHVVRTTPAGDAYDDTVDTLSKSEREVIGLVVALAGYLVHDVHERVPFVLIDAVEMFDADRIRGLVDHFADHATYVVATVLPETETRLEDRYESISTAASLQP
jgi:DNA repair exonuclease SbcCD ATPase subunit